jgi:hypothetical protein
MVFYLSRSYYEYASSSHLSFECPWRKGMIKAATMLGDWKEHDSSPITFDLIVTDCSHQSCSETIDFGMYGIGLVID